MPETDVRSDDKTPKKRSRSKKKIKSADKNVRRESEISLNISQEITEKDDVKPKAFPNCFNEEVIRQLKNLGVIFESTIRINLKFSQEAYLSAPDKSGDFFIENPFDRNRALEGDEVYAMVKPRESLKNGCKQRLAAVVGIKSYNHSRICIGSLSPFYNKTKRYARLVPTDVRLPVLQISDQYFPKGYCQRPMEFQECLFASTIREWTVVSHATGGPLTYLGQAGTAEAENRAILLKFDLDITPYPPEYNLFFPENVSHSNFQGRLDLRKECIFTIDPATARDLDDAVSCKIRSDGSMEIGVHIADVSFFLKEGTPLDEAVSKKATTIYLVDNVYHMLPLNLCALCSLSPGQDKLAFSVIWEFSPEGDIISRRFARSVINSCAQFSYEQVQAIIDGIDVIQPSITGGHSFETIVKTVLALNRLAVKLRAQRVENGALRIDQTKISFLLDPLTRVPHSFHQQEQLAAHKLIEEFMLLANTAVAETLQKFRPDLAFLRAHLPPIGSYLSKIQTLFESYGVLLDATSSKTLQASLDKLLNGGPEEKARLMVVNNALTKPMARAQYFCSLFREDADQKSHYALSVPLYTHFTSPIRRYADIMVHRLLAAAINIQEVPNWTPDYVQTIAEICNTKKYNAKMAGDASTELYFALFVGERGSVEAEAIVCYVGPSYCECILLLTGSLVKVQFSKLDGKVLKSEEGNQAKIQWKSGPTQIIDIFSIVNVTVSKGTGVKIIASLNKPSIEQLVPDF